MPEPSLASPSPADVQATFCATLVDQWARCGLRHAVVAPGSRSAPMALALAAHPAVTVHVVHDERAAGFVALGIGQVDSTPAAVLCTSGTASTHFHAPVVEASLSNVPMLVLTADRPPELRDVGAPQTIDQTHLYGRAVRWFHDPGLADLDAAHTWRSLAARAHDIAVAPDPGPVHLNLPFREPLLGSPAMLPDPVRVRTALDAPATAGSPLDVTDLVSLVAGRRGVIVAGRGVDDPAAVSALASALAWPVLADPRSRCRALPEAVGAFDPILRHAGFAGAHHPEVVLRLGEPPASRVLVEWIGRSSTLEIQVDPSLRALDPAHRLAHRVVAPVSAVCAALSAAVRDGSAAGAGASWLGAWLEAEARAQAAIDGALAAEAHLSEPAVARVVTGEAMAGCRLVLGSSMPVRDAEWFGGRCLGVDVHSNRGANGIDGVVATAVGVAIASGQPTVVLLGDVSLCHDASALTALAGRGLDLTVVVLDNDGGGIFSFLPQAAVLPDERFQELFGTPHGTDLVALAAAHGIAAHDALAPADILQALTVTGAALVRVAGNRADNVAVHRRLNDAVVAALDA